MAINYSSKGGKSLALNWILQIFCKKLKLCISVKQVQFCRTVEIIVRLFCLTNPNKCKCNQAIRPKWQIWSVTLHLFGFVKQSNLTITFNMFLKVVQLYYFPHHWKTITLLLTRGWNDFLPQYHCHTTHPVSPTSSIGSLNLNAWPTRTASLLMLYVHTICPNPGGGLLTTSRCKMACECANRCVGSTFLLMCFSRTSCMTTPSSGRLTRPAISM